MNLPVGLVGLVGRFPTFVHERESKARGLDLTNQSHQTNHSGKRPCWTAPPARNLQLHTSARTHGHAHMATRARICARPRAVNGMCTLRSPPVVSLSACRLPSAPNWALSACCSTNSCQSSAFQRDSSGNSQVYSGCIRRCSGRRHTGPFMWSGSSRSPGLTPRAEFLASSARGGVHEGPATLARGYIAAAPSPAWGAPAGIRARMAYTGLAAGGWSLGLVAPCAHRLGGAS